MKGKGGGGSVCLSMRAAVPPPPRRPHASVLRGPDQEPSRDPLGLLICLRADPLRTRDTQKRGGVAMGSNQLLSEMLLPWGCRGHRGRRPVEGLEKSEWVGASMVPLFLNCQPSACHPTIRAPALGGP